MQRSESVPVSSGVPQSSVLGPFLFLAYINYLPENISSIVRLFADDTAIYLTLTFPSQSSALQNGMETLQKWESDSDMEFNISKCQVIRVTRRQTPFQTRYFLHGTLLEFVTSVKYLGVGISENLSWDTHVYIQNHRKSQSDT